MKVMDELLGSIENKAKNTQVNEVRIGPFWTGVKSLYGGMASTFFEHEPEMEIPIDDAGDLTDKMAWELCQWAKSDNLLRSSVGMATINSILDVDIDQYSEVNAGDILINKGEGKKVTVVGHFPFVKKLGQIADELWILEKRPQPGDLPADKAPEVIPESDIVAITSTTLINNTLEGILDLCRDDSIVMLLGPTTPLCPLLFNHNIDIISGTRVIDPEVVMTLVSEGVVFRQMHGRGIKLLTLFKE